MKKKVALIFLVLAAFSHAQQKQFTINWEAPKTITTGSFSFKIPSFNKDHLTFSFQDGLKFNAQWPVTTPVNETSVKVTNVSYVSLSKKDLFDVDIETIPSNLKFSLKNSVSRNKRYAFFQISPIIKGANGTFKKVTSFNISYTTGRTLKVLQKNNQFKTSKAITNSVLSTGSWYKFYVDTTGVFKLSKSFLQKLGVSVNTIDPRTIKIYGNGGRMIPFVNAEPYPFDVVENAIKVVGEEDGTFDNNDYVLFYAQGPKMFNAESNTNINCYTNKTYYYINIGSGFGKRIGAFTQPTAVANQQISTYHDYKFYEKDEYNLAFLGRRWFGDRFDVENTKTVTFNMPGLVASQPISLKVYLAAVSPVVSTMELNVNGTSIANINMPANSNRVLATQGNYLGNVNVNTDNIEVTLTYNNQGNPSAVAYIDYVSVEAERNLNFSGKQFQFANKNTITASGVGQYNISNASDISEIWDVTNIYNVTNFIPEEVSNTLSFKANLGEAKTYVAVTSKDYFIPNYDRNTTVLNQNIKGNIFNDANGNFKDVDYLIVAPTNMVSQAERLAEINRNQYNLNVKVLSLEQIYAEFSTGNQDVGAIRNVVKYIYDNASTTENRIKYLCLLGDASFDYKDRINNNTNIVPSWYSYNSFSLTDSFVSDDFYGMMDDTEGNMSTSNKLDVAVGRILAKTPQQAKEMVDKIASYYTKESFGTWRNNFVLVSDDVDKDWEGILQETTDEIGNLVSNEKTFINSVKIHTDAYQQESSAGGDRYPQVNTAFVNAVDNGALVVNYFGHGGEDGLAEERIFQKTDIENLRNFCKLSCFVTVTCEFTKFDNPFRETAGELMYWNKQAGAISLITTTRQIYVPTAIRFNNTLGQYLFSYNDDDAYSDYEYPSMAEALRLTKTDQVMSSEIQRRLIFFIGDPAMKLSIPKPNIRLTKLNDIDITTATDTLKALGRVKLTGEVTDISGNKLTNYNGTLSTTIYDKPINRQTLANDGTRNNGEVVKLDFETLGEIIFRGQASVTNGDFEFNFVVPKDIGIPVGFGKVSFYAKNEAFLEDQTGASINQIKIGGINKNAAEDNIGPVITLYMNDENFVSGGITNESPTLLAKLEDSNGINTASGIGHDIVAIIDGDETNPVVLNDYYQTEVDDYQKGTVSFPFRDLEPGLHTLTLKAWDVYNNSSIAEIQFVVHNENQELVIENVLNYPNPFVNYTEFWFNHNSSAPLNVSIQIFTVSGKLVRTLNGQTTGGIKITSSLSRDVIWDGRDDFGDKIGKGVYVYKLTVQSNLLNKKVEKIQKLVIL